MSFIKNTILVAAAAGMMTSTYAVAQTDMKSGGMKSDGSRTGAMTSGATAPSGGMHGNMTGGSMGRSDSMPANGRMGGAAGAAPMSGGMRNGQ